MYVDGFFLNLDYFLNSLYTYLSNLLFPLNA
jgi:hypothetical protein